MHLDLKIPPSLFDEWWTSSSTKILESYLAHISAGSELSMVMLPRGVSPVGFAVLAALKYLPGLQKPPNPYCRIGLFPGARMYNQLRSFRLPSAPFNEVSRSARSLMRGELKLNGSVQYLEAKQDDYPYVYFHWIWRCDRITERYKQLSKSEVMPRSYFGSKDSYAAVIDLLDAEDPSLMYEKYDLFIYCPYYHSGALGRREEFQKILQRFKKVKADKKIILTKSPFDFWSKRFERELGLKGISLNSLVPSPTKQTKDSNGLKFTIVDQFISFADATILFRHLMSCKSRFEMLDKEDQFEWRLILKRLFNSVSPRHGSAELNFVAQRFQFLSKTIGLYEDEGVGKIVDSIIEKLRTGNYASKIEHFVGQFADTEAEIWVTKDSDERAFIEKFEDIGGATPIVLCNRWQRFLAARDRRRVRLSRLEHEADLNWVSYLTSGDEIVMTAWEAGALAQIIDQSWGRSLEWRGEAEKIMSLSEIGKTEDRQEDPVFLLADFLLAAKQNVEAISPEVGAAVSMDDSWWEEDSARENHEVINNISDLKGAAGEKVACIQVSFAGNRGTFLKANSYIQIIRGSGDAEFETVSATEIKPGDLVLLFKDGERESLFDLLTDQLAESDEWRPHIEILKKWKLALRLNFFSKHGKISSLLKSLETNGIQCDGVLARSWIFGSTMAPINLERTEKLAKSVGVDGIDIPELFKSVKKIRGISIRLGRLLNQIILDERSGELDDDQMNLIEQVGLDVEEIRAAVDIYKVQGISETKIGIAESSVRKLFATT